MIFSFNMPKSFRGVHFCAPECKGHTARRTASLTVSMNTGRVINHSRQHKQEIVPFLYQE